ncbi:MAG: DUF3301 domain-containing protein [Gammaproteobacteria bacterium]|nr:MAG: DUF3301 domain-containing protein [Gammaproteobacteria bacterium]
MSVLLALAVLVALVLLWQDALRARETALAIARQTCDRAGFQLLDATVALRRVGITRAPGAGCCALRRTYVFEYSVHGGDRRSGFVILAGHRPVSVGL